MEINEIKKRLPILTVLSKYSLKPDKNNHIRCPFHKDDKPSMKIYPETGTYHCFGCGKTGDQIQFIQDKEKCSQHEAILKAQSWIPGQVEAEPQQPTTKPTNTEKPWAELFPLFQNTIERSDKAKRYCINRRLDYKALQIGYNSGTYYKKIRECIIFPLKDKNGNTVSLYGRRISESNGYSLEYGKHYYSENRSGLYPCYPDPETEVLILTEAIIDAATLLQIPEITENYKILSCYGNLAFVKEAQEAVENLPKLQEVIIFFDGDQGGLDGIKHVTEILNQIKPDVKVAAVATPEKEDVNSLYVKYDKNCLLQLINERKPVTEIETSFSIEPTLIEPSEASSRPMGVTGEATAQEYKMPSPLNTENPNKIIYETQTARYIVKGGLPRQLDKMLISLDVQHLETGIKYRCRLDLYEERQTRKEAREAAEKLDLRADLIENDLSTLCDLLEEERETQLSNQSNEDPKKEKPVSFEWQARCKKILLSKTLMQDLLGTIKHAGVIGEEKNILMLFCSAFSFKMPETLHVIIQGSSGSGKTTLLSKTASFMPQERVIKFTRVTEGSFYNYDEYFFVGMYVCFEDLDGLKPEALLAVRELISNEILVSSTTWKDENGNLSGKPKTVRGPMASVSATTNGQIYEDNESRVFVIAVDESKEQTKSIISYQQKKAANIIDEEKEKEATELLQNLVRMLKPYKVLNPYADKVQLPDETDKLRRLSKLFLSLVNQMTLLHQYQRKKTKDVKLITTKEDVQNAIEILFDTIVLKIDELDGSLRQFFEQLKQWVQKQGHKPENFEFMRRDVRMVLHIKPTRLHYYIDKLVQLEYLQEVGGYNNRGLKYKIIWWDDYQAFRHRIKNHLLSQLDNLPDEITDF